MIDPTHEPEINPTIINLSESDRADILKRILHHEWEPKSPLDFGLAIAAFAKQDPGEFISTEDLLVFVNEGIAASLGKIALDKANNFMSLLNAANDQQVSLDTLQFPHHGPNPNDTKLISNAHVINGNYKVASSSINVDGEVVTLSATNYHPIEFNKIYTDVFLNYSLFHDQFDFPMVDENSKLYNQKYKIHYTKDTDYKNINDLMPPL